MSGARLNLHHKHFAARRRAIPFFHRPALTKKYAVTKLLKHVHGGYIYGQNGQPKCSTCCKGRLCCSFWAKSTTNPSLNLVDNSWPSQTLKIHVTKHDRCYINVQEQTPNTCAKRPEQQSSRTTKLVSDGVIVDSVYKWAMGLFGPQVPWIAFTFVFYPHYYWAIGQLWEHRFSLHLISNPIQLLILPCKYSSLHWSGLIFRRCRTWEPRRASIILATGYHWHNLRRYGNLRAGTQ